MSGEIHWFSLDSDAQRGSEWPVSLFAFLVGGNVVSLGVIHPPMKSPFGSKFVPVLLVGAACVSAPSARATLLIYEGFNGYSGTLATATPNANTVGLDQSLAYGSTGTGDFAISSGLSFSNLQVGGGAVSFNNTPASSVAAARITATLGTGATLYTSYLVELTSTRGAASGDGFEVRVANDTSTGGVRFRTMADTRSGASTNVVGVDYNGGATPVITNGQAGSTPVGTTVFLIVGSYTNTGLTLTGTTQGVGSTYAFSSDQFDHMMSQADPQAYLNGLTAANIGTGATQVYGFAQETISTGGPFGIAPGNFLQFVNVKDNGKLDEIRMGDTFASVVPIPEPGSLALLAAAGGLLVTRRKR